MMNKINSNPTYAAIFYFLLTWAGLPVAAFIKSSISGISFADAALSPYMLMTFATGAIIAASQMFNRAKYQCGQLRCL